MGSIATMAAARRAKVSTRMSSASRPTITGARGGRSVRKYLVAPFLLVLPWLLLFAIEGHTHPAVAIGTGIACWLAFLAHSPRWMAAALATGWAAGWLAGEGQGLYRDAALSGAAALCYWILMSARCPRCQYGLWPARAWHETQPSRHWCMMCGRDRKGVWPFQYLVRPEPWDGHYHDEGGGPANPDAFLDWCRDIMFRRLPKRWRRD